MAMAFLKWLNQGTKLPKWPNGFYALSRKRLVCQRLLEITGSTWRCKQSWLLSSGDGDFTRKRRDLTIVNQTTFDGEKGVEEFHHI